MVDKYKLADPNEYVTESEASPSSSEEEIDMKEAARRLRANCTRFMNEFQPPLSPPHTPLPTAADGSARFECKASAHDVETTEDIANVHATLCGGDAPTNVRKRKKKTRHLAREEDEILMSVELAEDVLHRRQISLHDQATILAGAGAFFDLFGGVLALTRLDSETSDEWNQLLRLPMRGLALVLNDADAALPSYEIRFLRFLVTKDSDDRIVKVDFKVLDVNKDQRMVLVQDQAIAANDGGSGEYSLERLTSEAATYIFEFPSRASSSTAVSVTHTHTHTYTYTPHKHTLSRTHTARPNHS